MSTNKDRWDAYRAAETLLRVANSVEGRDALPGLASVLEVVKESLLESGLAIEPAKVEVRSPGLGGLPSPTATPPPSRRSSVSSLVVSMTEAEEAAKRMSKAEVQSALNRAKAKHGFRRY